MPVPLDVYRPLLLEETLQIGTQQREADFAGFTVIGPPNQADEEQVYYLSFTNVHMVLGEPEPRLRRVQLHTPGVHPDVADDVVERVADRIEEMPHLHEDHMRAIAEMAVAVCEEYEEQETSLLVSPFRTLSIMAISVTTDGHPLVFQHSSRSFAETMSAHMPDRWTLDFSDMEEVPEHLYELAYSLEGEHQSLPPYETWKENVKGGVADVLKEGGNTLAKLCEGYLGYFLSREETMHPTLKKLFNA